MKRFTPIESLTKYLPVEIEDMLRYVRHLAFEAKPDYGFLKKMLENLFIRANFMDLEYDWKFLRNVNYLNA